MQNNSNVSIRSVRDSFQGFAVSNNNIKTKPIIIIHTKRGGLGWERKSSNTNFSVRATLSVCATLGSQTECSTRNSVDIVNQYISSDAQLSRSARRVALADLASCVIGRSVFVTNPEDIVLDNSTVGD